MEKVKVHELVPGDVVVWHDGGKQAVSRVERTERGEHLIRPVYAVGFAENGDVAALFPPSSVFQVERPN